MLFIQSYTNGRDEERNPTTDLLAPFNGMIAIGTHSEPLNPEAFLTLWEWR